MELKKREQEHQITLWIATSILLHFLIMLVAFFLYLEQMKQRSLLQESQPKNLDKEKQQMMNLHDPAVTYTLIPGRKAITTQPPNPTEKKQEKSNEEKHNNQKAEQVPTPPKKKEIPLNQQSKAKIVQNKPIPKADTKRSIQKETTKLEALQQQLTKKDLTDNILEDKLAKPQPIDMKAHKEPTIQKKKISLQDLQLGFNQFLNEGNNDILLQHGTTNQPPDAKALKLITYNQQVAQTMKSAIVTHHQYKQLSNILGKKIWLTITLDRSGKMLNLQIIQGSGDQLLDKITLESLRDIHLYPPVPKHIPNDPFTMKWTLLF